MKRFVFIFAFVLLFFGGVLSANAQSYESIQSFDAAITIQSSGTMRVQETILYDFGTYYKHGIYRDIPYRYANKGTSFTLRLSVISVTDDQNVPYPFTTSKSNGYLHLKIGDADKTINGLHSYVVTYDVERAVTTFSDHQELYWNVTGDAWQVPITKASTTISVQNSSSAVTDVICFTGAYESVAQQCDTTTDSGSASVVSTTPLSAGQGMTAVVSLKPGTVAAVNASKSIGWFIADNWPLLIPIFVWIFLHLYWMKHGRDPKVRTAIIPQYESPRGLIPGEVGALWNNKVDAKEISASVISLAVKGFIKIKSLEKNNYQFIKLKKDSASLSAFEKNLLSSLFLDIPTLTMVELKDLRNKFYKSMTSLQDDLYKALVGKALYVQNPKTLRNALYGVGGFCLALPIFLAREEMFSLWTLGVPILSGALCFLYGSLMPQTTVEGALAKREIEGFKWFLTVTEKERLKFFNAPAKKPEQFQEFLPYAIALGVEKEWAKQFEGMTITPPSWYDGNYAAFNALYFASALSTMNSSMASGFTSRPGGTSSGFGGGGFSGGGFGGGGGGSW